jgi:hypothetical protein
MENDKNKLAGLIGNPGQYFAMLKPASATRKNIYNLQIDVTGYADLFCLVTDLLKAGMLALDGIEGSELQSRQTEKYIYSLLRIIEKLIPIEEANLLDLLHEQYVSEKTEEPSKK